MDTTYPKNLKTKGGSEVIVFGEIGDQLYGAWNDGNGNWYASQWHRDGRRFEEFGLEVSLDLVI